MGICSLLVEGRLKFHSMQNACSQRSPQLPDPNAGNFTLDILKQAMLETISTLNHFAEEASITEVCFI